MAPSFSIFSILSLGVVVCFFSAAVLAQQVPKYILPYELYGLSKECLAVVNTTVTSCPSWLPTHAGLREPTVNVLSEERIGILCETSCFADLKKLRTSIQAACANDVMVPPWNIAYPATFMVDRYLYAISLSCLKDKQSGRYCDIMVAEWRNETAGADDHACSFCWLGLEQIQLSSPFGYSDADAADFSSMTSSCSAEGYSYATPTKYAINSTSAAPAASPTCTGSWYNIQEDDTCVVISGAHNVSTYNLIQENALDVGCFSLHQRERLCLPQQCKTHQLALRENCSSLTESLNITMAQLLAWNPMISPLCTNLASWRGWYLCASSPTRTIPVREGGSLITAVPVPTNAQPETNPNCGQWYQVGAGDDCSKISLKFGISLKDFYFLNPQVNHKCENLWLNYSYCVQPVGDIGTYTGYPISTPSVTFTRPSPTSTSASPTRTEVWTPVPSPLAPGTIEGCYLYENAYDEESASDASLNLCWWWAANGEVDIQEFLAWNPSLLNEDCHLKPGYRYCIRRWKDRPTLPHVYCSEPNPRFIPSPSIPQSECTCYLLTDKTDKKYLSCSEIPGFTTLSVSELRALNPWIEQDCKENTFTSRLSEDGYLQLCLERSGSSTISTTSSTPMPTSLPPSAPTQPGADKNCNKWHVISEGDNCWSISQKYGISLDDFLLWNPGVGKDCSALWLNYGVCIGV
ncbi:Carbohydrate-binding module family 50 protein [Trichophyton interdigitale]|uniref:Carbohydrate-binding module family 50 protein n=1 Tax=Trichophyton interdigitale TaxID=101480 RepID=A0A9P4YMG4_9EURO|nr:Carbohydrate-binding module family 50 protein [Trichophyton interdigitale]KAF3901251.1 Carbohydrate-binding module family 50 protein [Trichophyton interdigitale]KAG8212385.1 Carbohydrate-binding module family 50 protein [Trichophyton interdigitale]